MTDSGRIEQIIRRRMHGLYLSRKCPDITSLAHELLGLHSWFYRNVPFSALIRGADIAGWKTALTKTWLYRGTLHGVTFEDLPTLLALHNENDSFLGRYFDRDTVDAFENRVLRYMEDGVFSRAEFRRIFADDCDPKLLEAMFSPWGGIFVHLARQGKVAFRDMASRDFDLIDAEPTQTLDDVLPDLLRRYFAAYGPATIQDAAWFFGFWKNEAKKLAALPLDDLEHFELNGHRYYYCGDDDTADIPAITLLSGFDPLIVSYTDRSAVLPQEHKAKVILKSGICNPTIAVNGRVAGIWNIKKTEPIVEFFEAQPKAIVAAAHDMIESISWRTR